MHARFLSIALLVAFLAPAPGAHAQAPYKQLPVSNENYVKPFPPLRIVGNLYYVGTYHLACYLITTSAGNILINTGINDSVPAIRSSIEALGFKFGDIKLLLATHGHWDHVAGMAEIKRLTGARMLMQEGDAAMLEDGGNSDYRYPQGRGAIYEPVKVDQRLKDGDKVRLGDVELTVLHHPGHTKGATSFMYTVRERGRTYNVLIANMASINPGVKVSGMPGFPEITDAYLQTLAKQKQLNPDIWVASHAAQFNLHQKYKPGDPYDPNRFVDPEGYQAKVRSYEKLVQENLKKDARDQ